MTSERARLARQWGQCARDWAALDMNSATPRNKRSLRTQKNGHPGASRLAPAAVRVMQIYSCPSKRQDNRRGCRRERRRFGRQSLAAFAEVLSRLWLRLSSRDWLRDIGL